MDRGRNGNGGDIIGGSVFCSDRYSYLIKVRIQKSLTWSSKLMSHGVKSHRPLTDPLEKFIVKTSCPVDTERKLNVHKTFRRRPGRLLNVLCTFNLRPVSTGSNIFNNIKRMCFPVNFVNFHYSFLTWICEKLHLKLGFPR